MMPKVVLLGRPNVGKSTLFNRLIRSNRAITHDRPGVTRDRMEGVVRSRFGRDFALVDTGGITLDSHQAVAEGPAGIRGFEADILRQAEAALKEDLSKAGVTLPGEFKFEVSFKEHRDAVRRSFFPGFRLEGDRTIVMETHDFMDVLRAVQFVL